MASSIVPNATCTTCRLVFESSKLQRAHHQSEWHLYNMHRKMANLDPVSLRDFEEKAAEHRQAPVLECKEHLCKPCGKRFHSLESYQTHVQSKRHMENDKLMNIKEAVEAAGCDETKSERKKVETGSEVNAVLACLFCNQHSKSMELNLDHMLANHSFFIPDVEYCCNVEGLLEYLHEKVAVHHCCLWCGDKKVFPSTVAVQTHMKDKGHCKMYHYEAAVAEFTDFYDYSKSNDSDSDEDSDNESMADFGLVAEDGYHLYLPSGAVAGHRSLFRYYRQHLRKVDPLVQQQQVGRIVERYRSYGWNPSSKGTIKVRAKDQRTIQRFRNKYALDVGVKGNKLQRHLRKQVLC